MRRAIAALGLLFTFGSFFYIDSSTASQLPERDKYSAQYSKQYRSSRARPIHVRRAVTVKTRSALRRWQHRGRTKHAVRIDNKTFNTRQSVAGVGGSMPQHLIAARSWLGRTASQLGLPRSLWCADFINKTLRAAGLPAIKSRRARDFAGYGARAWGPAPGVIAIIPRGRDSRKGHVMIVQSVKGNGTFVAISGNHGGRVRVATYSTRRVISWRWPPGMS